MSDVISVETEEKIWGTILVLKLRDGQKERTSFTEIFFLVINLCQNSKSSPSQESKTLQKYEDFSRTFRLEYEKN